MASTNNLNYYKIGTAVNANYRKTNNPPNTMIYRLARLYDPINGLLASDVTSLKIIQKNVGYGIESGKGIIIPPGTPQGSYDSIQGSAINEIDIIEIPESPAFLILYFGFLILYFIIIPRRNNELIK